MQVMMWEVYTGRSPWVVQPDGTLAANTHFFFPPDFLTAAPHACSDAAPTTGLSLPLHHAPEVAAALTQLLAAQGVTPHSAPALIEEV